MPYIKTRTNQNLTKEQEKNIKSKLGEAIKLINKSEDWLMVEFVPECHLYFKGEDQEPIAFVEVKIYGKSSSEAYNNLTKVISDILTSEISIPQNNIYISYSEHENWGWNGSNF